MSAAAASGPLKGVLAVTNDPLVSIDFMRPARITRPAGLANLERWYAEVSARPSAKA